MSDTGRNKMFNWRELSWKHIFVVLLILYLLPIWIFAYFPSQDGPSHVYNALVLKEYSEHANYKIRDAWKLNITIFPNWLSHIVLAALLYVFPPVISEKVFLTIAIGMIPIAFFYFIDAVHKNKKDKFIYAWLGFPFAYNYLLYMGFYNFTLSISFFFFSFGYWWKHKDNMQVKQICVLYVLLLLTYLSHIVSYGLVVLGISVAAGSIWGCESLVEVWKTQRHSVVAMLKQFFIRLKPFLRFLFYMVPIYFVLMEYYLQSVKRHPTGSHRGMDYIWDYFLDIGCLVYFTHWHKHPNHFLLVVLGIAVLIAVGYRIYRKEWIQRTDVFLLIAILFTYMFIKAPWSYGPGGWINDRIYIYILLMLAPWLIIDMHKIVRYGITTCIILFALIHFGRTAYEHGSISPEMAELVSGTDLIEPHTTFSIRTADGHKSEALGRVDPVAPFIHTQAFYGVYADDVVHMANYEANYYYFPVNRNNKDSVGLDYIRADYVIAWMYPETEPFADLKPNYDIIHETEHLKLFKRKTQPPALDLWDETEDGNLIIRFDMQPDNAEAEKNYHIVGPKTMFVSGKYGWDTEWNPKDPLNKSNWRISPRAAYLGPPEETTPLTRDAVHGREDAAFRIDLPNGTYRITNIFQTAEDATHEVNMLANGKKIIKKLFVPPHNKMVEKEAIVEVENNHLVLVIYTSKKRIETDKRHIHWIWNGCTVEQISTKEETSIEQ